MPLIVVAGVGTFYQTLGLVLSAVATALVCIAYAWQMRPLYTAALPLNPWWTNWLLRLKILPPTLPVPAAAASAIEKPVL
jgi:hypothetical protein